MVLDEATEERHGTETGDALKKSMKPSAPLGSKTQSIFRLSDPCG